jgi:hypothetical protein
MTRIEFSLNFYFFVQPTFLLTKKKLISCFSGRVVGEKCAIGMRVNRMAGDNGYRSEKPRLLSTVLLWHLLLFFINIMRGEEYYKAVFFNTFVNIIKL